MKKGFTVLEMMVYIFVVSVVGLYVSYVANRFFDSVVFNNNIRIFSQNYNNFLSDIYSKGYNGWFITGTSQNNGLALYNSGIGYVGYQCFNTGIVATNISPSLTGIVWTGYNQVYTGFICNSLTGSTAYAGFWVNVDFTLYQRNLKLNYYIQK